MSHGTHCNQGEYLGGCKYGEAENCPELIELRKKRDMQIPADTPISVHFWPELPRRLSMDEDTYGNTPAAKYLARTLNKIGDAKLARTVGKRVSTTCKQVQDLLIAYYEGVLPAKTVANTLRLMREEIAINATVDQEFSDQRLVDQLRSNVQIGHIKQGIRLASVARKAERVMQNPIKRSSRIERTIQGPYGFVFHDKDTKTDYIAGTLQEGGSGKFKYDNNVFFLDDIQDVTAETLQAKSDARCKRLGKPHTRY